jgi:hypothetical protein
LAFNAAYAELFGGTVLVLINPGLSVADPKSCNIFAVHVSAKKLHHTAMPKFKQLLIEDLIRKKVTRR